MESAGLRQRRRRKGVSAGATASDTTSLQTADDGKKASAGKTNGSAPSSHGDAGAPVGRRLGVLCYLVGLIVLCGVPELRDRLVHALEELAPVDPSLPAPMSEYQVSKAMQHVETIAARPRWVGSNALDESMEYIMSELLSSAEMAEKNAMKLEVEMTYASGSFECSMGPTNVLVSYGNVSSVVARLSYAGEDAQDADMQKSLLVNAHVDSAWGAPGANDNVVGVGVAMEALRSIAATPPSVNRLQRPVVFLFNGAEEPLLAGAHGFMTTHRWAGSIAAHINLEAVGSGDSYTLFRLGPGNTWLAKAYASAVKRPRGTVSATDVYDAGLVPGETDFRIFSQFDIPGYDFALLNNGFVYHTTSDDIKHVSKNAIEHGGRDIVLPLVMELAANADKIGEHIADAHKANDPGLPEMARIGREISALAGGRVLSDSDNIRAVFFDVASQFVVVYSQYHATVINLAATLFFVVAWFASIPREQSLACAIASRTRMLFCLIGAGLASLASATAGAFFYTDMLESPLGWYGSPLYGALMYAPIAMVGALIVLRMTLPRAGAPDVNYANMLAAAASLQFGVLVALVAANLMTAYIPCGLLITTSVVLLLFSRRGYVFPNFMLMIVPTALLGTMLWIDTLSLIMSVMGRAGSLSSDIAIACVVAFIQFVYLIVPLAPVVAKYPSSWTALRKLCMFVATMMALWVWVLPELTLPHRSAVYTRHTPKRIIATHFRVEEDPPRTYLALMPLDAVPVDVNTTVRALPINDKSLLETVPHWGALQSKVSEPLRPYERFVADPETFETEEPLDLPAPTVEVVREEPDETAPGHVNVTIAVHAPHALQVSVRVLPLSLGGDVVAWSLGSDLVDMGDGRGAWVRHVGRGDAAETLEFSVLVPAHDGETRPRVAIDVTSARPGTSRSALLRKLYFPQWAAPVFIQATGAGFEV